MRPNLVRSAVAQAQVKWTTVGSRRSFSSPPTKNNKPRQMMSMGKAFVLGFNVFALSELARFYVFRYPPLKKRWDEYELRTQRYKEKVNGAT